MAGEFGSVGAVLGLFNTGLVDAFLNVGHVLHPVKVEELLLSSVLVHGGSSYLEGGLGVKPMRAYTMGKSWWPESSPCS